MHDYFDEEPDVLSSEDDLSSAHSSDEDDDDDDGDDGGPQTYPPPPISQNFFAPPFYGRPPTPLPPSPSLTSLLRPSRPTTPDASDDEGNLEPVPRASPKVPTYEYYGFVLYLFSSLAFLIYLLWAYLPSPFLHALGIFYYPNRWWALAVPAFLVMLIVYIYVALACYNTEYLTLPMASLETVVDEAAKVACVDSRGRLRPSKRHDEAAAAAATKVSESRALEIEWRAVWNKGTDGVMDVPLAGVNEVLYGNGDHDDDDF